MAEGPIHADHEWTCALIRDLGEWVKLKTLVDRTGFIRQESAEAFDLANPAPMAFRRGLLASDEGARFEDRPAERDVRRRIAQRAALGAHLEVCKALPICRALDAKPEFAEAERLMLGPQWDDPDGRLKFLGALAGAAATWAMFRGGVDQGRALRMRLTKREAQEAACLADGLRAVLGDVVDCGSKTAAGFYYSMPWGIPHAEGSMSFHDLLRLVAEELRAHATTPVRVERNDSSAIDRRFVTDAALSLQAAFGAVRPRVIELLCRALGMALDPRNVRRAVQRAGVSGG